MTDINIESLNKGLADINGMVSTIKEKVAASDKKYGTRGCQTK